MAADTWPAAREAVGAQSMWIGLAAVGALVVFGLAAWIETRRGRAAAPWVRRVIVAGAASFGLYLAWQRLWLCDDAFITFRYALNFSRGEGLVFNPGEWVEGYTNFLWTVLLGALGYLGVDIPMAGLFGNLATFVATVVLTGWVVARVAASPGGTPRGPETPGRAVAVPFAAIVLGTSLGFTTFASSGLETMPATMLVVAGIAATVANRPLLAGTLLILGAMTRPDHLLFWGCMGLAMAVEDVVYNTGPLLKRARWGRYLRFAAPLVVLYVPYFLWRWRAYGDLFPNTYYAKSGDLTYYSQGWTYAAIWAAGSGAWLWAPALLLGALGKPRGRHEWRLRIFALLAVVIFGRYVVRVGGDFMQDRFFVVLWPVVLIALESTLRARIAAAPSALRRAPWLPLAALTLGASVVPVKLIPERDTRWFVAAEYTYYRVKSLFPLVVDSHYFRRGHHYAESFAGLDPLPRFAIGCVGMVGFYSGLPLVDTFGLTNRRIAHRPVKKRGRPGHEKRAVLEDVLAEGTELSHVDRWGDAWHALTRMTIGGETMYLMRDSGDLRRRLAGRLGLRLPQTPSAALGRAIERLARADALMDWRFLSRFVDRSTHGALIDALDARLGAVADFEFEGWPEGTQVEGDAVAATLGHVPEGASGEGWLRLGAGTRTVRIPVDLTGKKELRFALGGTASAGHRVELQVNGVAIHSATPSGRTGLHPVSWPLSGVGAATLAIIDADADPLATLDVDAIYVPGRGDISEVLRSDPPRQPARWLAYQTVVDAELPPEHPDRALLGRLVDARWSFEGPAWPEGTVVEGNAFGAGPVAGPIEQQGPIAGETGEGFANSYHGRDRGQGTLRLPEFEITGQPVGLRVGGSDDCEAVYAGLEVDGVIVARACGKGDEVLRTAVMPTHAHVGKRGRVVLVDTATKAWGHLLADDVVVMRNPPSTQVIPSQPPLR